MRKLFYGISVVAMALGMVACDDSVSSANNENADKESSSSVISEDASSSSVKPGYSSSVELASSSSVKLVSSSSVKPGSSSSKNDDPKSSCSEISSSSEKSSSSVNSSSSIESISSSSVTLSDMSSLGGEVGSSSSSGGIVSYSEMTDSRDGQVYKIVKIGTQVWMAENLNYADSTKTPSLKGKSWCYDNKAENCEVTGRFYTWSAAIDSVALANDANDPLTCGYGETCLLSVVVRGICPDGWHLPTYDEWETLFTSVGGKDKAGVALKSGSGWYSNGNGMNNYGFSALPAGFKGRNSNYAFLVVEKNAFFWSASEFNDDSEFAYCLTLDYRYESGSIGGTFKDYGYSVRCLQDSN